MHGHVPEYPDPRFSFRYQLAMTAGIDGGESMLSSELDSSSDPEKSSALLSIN